MQCGQKRITSPLQLHSHMCMWTCVHPCACVYARACVRCVHEMRVKHQHGFVYEWCVYMKSACKKLRKDDWEDWRCGSSNRVPALQARSPEFEPQSYKKKIIFEKSHGPRNDLLNIEPTLPDAHRTKWEGPSEREISSFPHPTYHSRYSSEFTSPSGFPRVPYTRNNNFSLSTWDSLFMPALLSTRQRIFENRMTEKSCLHSLCP
jgi:hypothetical protein